MYGGQMGVRPNAVSGASSFPGARPAQPAASPAFPSMAGVSSLVQCLSKSFPMNCRVHVAAYIALYKLLPRESRRITMLNPVSQPARAPLCSRSQPNKRIVSHQLAG